MEKGTGSTVLELTGNRRAVVDGCDGIVDYDDTQVIVRMGRLTVRLSGTDLKLRRLTESAAVVEGVLRTVEYGA